MADEKQGVENVQKTEGTADQSKQGAEGNNSANAGKNESGQQEVNLNQATIDSVAQSAKQTQQNLNNAPENFLNTPDGQAMKRQIDGLSNVYGRWSNNEGQRQKEYPVGLKEPAPEQAQVQRSYVPNSIQQQNNQQGDVKDPRFDKIVNKMEMQDAFTEARVLQSQVPEFQTNDDVYMIAQAGPAHPEYQVYQSLVDLDNGRASENLKGISLSEYFVLRKHRVGGYKQDAINHRMLGREDAAKVLQKQQSSANKLGTAQSVEQSEGSVINRVNSQADFNKLTSKEKLTLGREYEQMILEEDEDGGVGVGI